MAVVADTGGLYALYDADDRFHSAVRTIIRRERDPLIIPAVILAELDYLLAEHLGTGAELDFVDDLIRGVYALEPILLEDLIRCREIMSKYRDLEIGLVDAGVIATAERLQIDAILTVDQRHFRTVRPRSGRPFTLLPFDRM